MQWFDNLRIERETKAIVIKAVNSKIKDLASTDTDEITITSTDENGKVSTKTTSKVDVMMDLVEKKRSKVKMNGVDAGDIVKTVANIAIVMVLVGFEMGNILNQKGSRFIKTL